MSDSWILIALTILVVLLLFYLSKKMICNSYGSSGGDVEDSPTTTSPSSSTTSTSFSDYLYGGYEGRSPLDLMDAAAITTSNGTSPESDDLAIDIADSLNYPGDHHYQNHHYRSDNRCPSINNNNNNNGNYNHSRNNLDLSNSVSSNGRRMSCDGGGRGGDAATIIGSGIIDSNNRGMDFGGSPPPPTLSSSSAATTGSLQQPILSPISIIAGPALERKTMLEIQLRNQIAKIVQAEREIQRLVQLLSLEQQRQGLDIASNNMLAAARASLLQHHQRYPQLYRHLRGIQYPPLARLTTTTTITSPSSEPEAMTRDATEVAASTPTPCNNSIIKNSNIPSLSRENVSTTNMAAADNHGNEDHHQNPTTSETTLPGNLCHSHHTSYHHRNENLLANSTPRENSPAPAERLQQNLILSCGLNANSIVNFHHHHQQQQQHRYCACNLCFNGTGTRRMLMLRRMLLPLPISTFPIDTNANPTEVAMEPGASASRGDFLTRSLDPLAHDLHYPREEQRQQQQHHHRRHIQQPVPAAEPQSGSGFSDYSHQHHPDNYYHHHHQHQNHQLDDDPPPYEECIRSSGAANRNTSYFDEGQNQDLYNNNYSSSPSNRSSNTTSNNRENRVKQTQESISVLA